jgi:hypothetical protein
MRITTRTAITAAAFCLAGCGKPSEVSGSASEPTNAPPAIVATNPAVIAAPPAAVIIATPVVQPILTVWQEGNRAAAVNLFVAANWNASPIFPPGMALALTDGQINSLPEADRQLRTSELFGQVDLLKQLINAVNEAGKQSASQSDTNQARQCFSALKQFGTALDNPPRPQVVRTVGIVAKNMAKKGLAKLGP